MVLRGIATVLVWLLVFPGTCLVSAAPAVDLFEAGADHYGAGRWSEAARAFEQLLATTPNGEDAEDARFYLGEARLQGHDFEAARIAFAELLATAPQGAHAEQARYRLGEIAYLSNQPVEAQRLLTAFLAEGSESSLAPFAHAYLGQLWLELGDNQQALTHLTSAMTGALPDKLLLETRLAWAHAQAVSGNSDRALDQYERLAGEDDPVIAEPALMEAAILHYEQGDAAVAEERFAAFLERFGGSQVADRARLGMAWCLRERGEYQRASDVLAELFEQNPDSSYAAEATWLLATCLESLDQADAALACYQRVWTDYSESPQRSAAMIGAARLHERLSQFQEAQVLYRRWLDECPEEAELAEVLYDWHWVLTELGDQSAAFAALDRLRRECPDSTFWSEATYRLAEQAYVRRDTTRAESLLDEMAQNPTDANVTAHALHLQGLLAADRNDWDGLLAAMDALATRCPQHELAEAVEFWRGEACFRRQDWEAARKHYLQSRDVTAAEERSWSAQAELRLAQIAGHLKQWKECLACAEQLLETRPGFAEAYEAEYLRGRALAALGDRTTARQAFEQVLNSARGGASETAALAQLMIGSTYLDEKNYEAALAAFVDVDLLSSYPQWQAFGLFQAGQCCESLSRWPEAVSFYTRLLRTHPQHELAEQVRMRLAAVDRLAEAPRQAK
jgi:TolA-binding protein